MRGRSSKVVCDEIKLLEGLSTNGRDWEDFVVVVVVVVVVVAKGSV